MMRLFRASHGESGRARRAERAARRPAVEALEGRQLLSADAAQFPVAPGAFVGQMVPGPFGAVWFQKQVKSTGDFSLPLTSTLSYVTPDGVTHDYALPGQAGAFTGPQALAAGPDGSLNVLTASYQGGKVVSGIARIAADGTLTQLPLTQPIITGSFYKYGPDSPQYASTRPTYTSLSIAAGGDGSVYVASSTPSGGGYRPFTKIDRVAPDGTVTEYPINRYAGGSIAVDHDGNVWFTTFGPGGEANVARMAPDGSVTDHILAGVRRAPSLVATADGNVWFSATFDAGASPAIGRIAPDGIWTARTLDLPGGSIGQLAAGSDGKVYFTALAAPDPAGSGPGDYLVRSIDAAGTITPVGSFAGAADFVDLDAASITTGPNGQVWFAQNAYQSGTAQIGTLVVNPGYIPAPVPVPAPPAPPADPPANPAAPTDLPQDPLPGPGSGPIAVSPGESIFSLPPNLAVDLAAEELPTFATQAATTADRPAVGPRITATARGRSTVVLRLAQGLNAKAARRRANFIVSNLDRAGAGSVPIASVRYNARQQTVTLQLRNRLAAGSAYRVAVSGLATGQSRAVVDLKTRG